MTLYTHMGIIFAIPTWVWKESVVRDFLVWIGKKKDAAVLTVSAVALVVQFFGLVASPIDVAWVAIVLCGVPIVRGAVVGFFSTFRIRTDLLVSIALVAAVATGEEFAAGEVAFIMQLGELLEGRTIAKARAGIEKLIRLTPCTARIVSGSEVKLVTAEQVAIGNLLRVLPGETVPVDGIIRSGNTSINQAVLTGESLPVDKASGDQVFSGTVNQFGSFDMEATKTGEDSSFQRMARLVQTADAGKARIVGLANKWAKWVVLTALGSSVLTLVVTGEVMRAVTVLVVFCPCALVLATPTAIMAAVANATRHGFLVREGDALERLAEVSAMTFDKTGTLTHGTPEVVAVRSFVAEIPESEIAFLAACAESRSEHPLGRAVVRGCRGSGGKDFPTVEGFQMLPGLGVLATVEGRRIAAGNMELLKLQGVAVSATDKTTASQYMDEGCTAICLAVDGKLVGLLALSDTPRPEAAEMIVQIRAMGIEPVLLTGDHAAAARHVGDHLHIDDVRAECLPETKLNHIESIQNGGNKVCMVGDGINDAPALKKAYVGIAMGGIGSDVAIEAADIALINDDIGELPHLIGLAKRMMRTINRNLALSLVLNFTAISLAMAGILNPVGGALVHNAGSVFVVLNSTTLLRWGRVKNSAFSARS